MHWKMFKKKTFHNSGNTISISNVKRKIPQRSGLDTTRPSVRGKSWTIGQSAYGASKITVGRIFVLLCQSPKKSLTAIVILITI